jgi:uncharacterized protein YyaL (SSP411 family)
MLHVIRRRFLPNAIVMRASEAPVEMTAQGRLAAAYVCENYACKLPVTGRTRLRNYYNRILWKEQELQHSEETPHGRGAGTESGR